ncbi:MAG TPA: hypothetical protein VIM29_03530 [Bacillota bacterium]
MRAILSKTSISLFILIFICFFLPFTSVSCDNKEVIKLTGIQLVTGTEIKTKAFLYQEERQVPPQRLAIMPFGLVVTGLISGLVGKGKVSAGWQTLSSAGAALSLFWLKAKLANEVLKYPKMVFIVNYLPGYWLALALCIAAAVVNGMSLLIKDDGKPSRN